VQRRPVPRALRALPGRGDTKCEPQRQPRSTLSATGALDTQKCSQPGERTAEPVQRMQDLIRDVPAAKKVPNVTKVPPRMRDKPAVLGEDAVALKEPVDPKKCHRRRQLVELPRRRRRVHLAARGDRPR